MNKNKSRFPHQEYIDALKEFSEVNSEARCAAKQLLYMHKEIKKISAPVILELGVDRGQSTKVFLNAINGNSSAHLISVDIRNCSNVSDSEYWTFLKMNSLDVDKIIEEAPKLKDGIDIIYIDSLHTPEHVYGEIYSWFPFLNKNGIIFFDDIDSGPYLQGQRKDNFQIEISNRKIFELIESIFISNIDILDFSILKGSTGLGILKKICSRKIELKEPKYIKKRKNLLLWKIYNKLFQRKQYKHSLDSSQSFLIDVTKY